MPQPLYAVGDLHVALEQVILVTDLRVDPTSGDVFFALRIQGSQDPIRVSYGKDGAERARAERTALLTKVGEARLLNRRGQQREGSGGE